MTSLREKLKIPPFGKGRKLAAVDFDSRRLRLVLAETTPAGTRIGNIASVALPEEIEATDPQAFGRLLARSLKDMGFRGAGLVMNVPRSQVVLKTLSLPPGTPDEELPGMVYYQVEKELPFPAQEAVVDFIIEPAPEAEPDRQEGEPQPEINVLVAAIRQSVVDYYKQIAQAAGLKLLRLGLRPCANTHCVLAAETPAGDENLAVVQITADETEIDLISHNSLVFSRSAVRNVSAVSGLDAAGISRTVNWVATEVALSLQSYQAVERGAKLTAVLLAGETGLESQAAEVLEDKLSVPCRTLQPGRAFPDKDNAQVPSAFISGLGLAVEHFAKDVSSFDFVDPKRPPAKRDPRKARAAAIIAAVAVLLLAAVVTRGVIVGGAQDRVSALAKRNNKLKESIKAVKSRAKRVDAMEDWQVGSYDWLAQWAHLSCLLPSAKDVYLTKLDTSPDGTITFSVQARNTEAITALNQQLEKAGYKFKPGQTKGGKDAYGYRWTTTVKVLASSTAKADLATASPVPRPKDDSTAEQFLQKSAPAKARPRRRR